MFRLIYNQYADADPARNAELVQCQQLNATLPWLEVIALRGRPTFEQMFAVANDKQGGDDISVIANSDIFFDDSLQLAESMGAHEGYALARWDVWRNGDIRLWDRPDAQDAWIFRGPIRKIRAPFTSGVRGCDNRLAHEMSVAGYAVSNPSKTIRANHLHLSAVRRYRHEKEFHVPPPYLTIAPTDLGVIA